MSTLSDLFPKTRAEILRLLFETGDQEIHLRDLARLAGLSPAALQKELTNLAVDRLLGSDQGNANSIQPSTRPASPPLRDAVDRRRIRNHPSARTSMKSTARFSVDPRLSALLGESYTSSERALRELVDNAWDAEARVVKITLPGKA